MRGFNCGGNELNNGVLSHNEHKGQLVLNGTLRLLNIYVFNIWQPLTFNSLHAWEEKSQCLRLRGLGCGDNRSWRIRSLCRDHSCCYPVEHCSNNSVFPSVSECIFLKSSFGCGLIHRNTKYATMLAQNGINIPASSFIEWQITPSTTALYNPNPFQTFGFLPCHRYGHLNSWLAAILSEVEKKPHLSMALVIASHQSSPSRTQAVLSAPWKQDQGSCRGDESVSGSLSWYQHWRPFHGAGLSRPNPREERAINVCEEADASTTHLHVRT